MHEPTTQNPTPDMTIIGADTHIKGEMFFEQSARILGRFEGTIRARGEVQVGPEARCDGTIEAERVVVDGMVAGPIVARDRLMLTATARVEGDLTAGSLVVAEGATFAGACNVGPQRQSDGSIVQEPKPAHQQARRSAPSPLHLDDDPQFRPPWANTNASGAPAA